MDCPLNLVGNENNCCCAKKCERIEVFAVFADFNFVRDRSTKKESLVGRSAERQFEVLQCADPGSLRRGKKQFPNRKFHPHIIKPVLRFGSTFNEGSVSVFSVWGGGDPLKRF